MPPAAPPPVAPPRRGVYFLANDRVADLALAFLNSFRAHNPTLPLCLIPYDDGHERILAYRDRHDFSVWSDAAVLAGCDAISRHFHPHAVGHYRKLAAWEGPFEEFIFIDIDTVVLRDVTFVFALLAEHDFVTSHSSLPHLRQWVWKPGVEQAGELTAEQIAFAANTGFIASRRSALRLADAVRRLPRALRLRPYMELVCFEQPLLNYLIVTSGRRYTSLLLLLRQGQRGLATEQWGGGGGGWVWRGRIVFPGHPPVLLVHWAGCWQPTRWDARIAAIRRWLGLPPLVGVRSRRLKYGRLWRYYRDRPPVRRPVASADWPAAGVAALAGQDLGPGRSGGSTG